MSRPISISIATGYDTIRQYRPYKMIASTTSSRLPTLLRSQPLAAARAFSTTPRLPASHPKADASQSYIRGTVNDPTTFPPPNAAHGSHHWLFERGLSVALLPLTAAAVAKHGSSGVLDAALGLSLVIHSHIGFDCCLQDYLHERKFPIAGKVAPWALRAFTAASLVGLYEIQTNDVGLSEFVARVWTA
ncbi:unnamed protein product [Sympodiomycopsis kandeliae]